MNIFKKIALMSGILGLLLNACGGGSSSGGGGDTTAPVVNSFTMPPSANTLTVPVSSFIATDAVGVTGYLITESSTTPSASVSGWSATVPTSFTFSAAGSNNAYAWAKDAAGNVSSSRSAHVTILTGLVSASMNTVTGINAVGTVTISGLPAATACGLSVQISYPSTVTFISAVPSGILIPIASSVTPGIIGATGTQVFISGNNGFGSGEVMKINFNNVLPTDLLGASVINVFDCFGVQVQ